MRVSLACVAPLAITAALLAPGPAYADRFELSGGGAIEGTLLNRQQTPRTAYEIRTPQGIRLSVPADQVVSVARQKDAEEAYRRVAPGHRDTVDDQWQLAEWCRQHDLPAQRKLHLGRIITLDPDHVAARHALGYVQLQGKWTTRTENLTSKGYRLFRGEWRSPQDIALIEGREKEQRVARQWLSQLKQWRSELADVKLAPAAYQRIGAVRDAAAVGPLLEMVRVEPTRDVKALYVEVLGHIGTAQAVEALVHVSLNDPDVEIFHTCAETLERLEPPNLHEPYLKALKDQNNVRLNRAAHMLGRIGEKSAIGPLIDVLITSHRVVIGPARGASGEAYSTSFSPDGGNSFQAGDSTKVFDQVAQNQEVLDALTRLAGGTTFGYNQAAWRRWHAVELSRAPAVDLRK